MSMRSFSWATTPLSSTPSSTTIDGDPFCASVLLRRISSNFNSLSANFRNKSRRHRPKTRHPSTRPSSLRLQREKATSKSVFSTAIDPSYTDSIMQPTSTSAPSPRARNRSPRPISHTHLKEYNTFEDDGKSIASTYVVASSPSVPAGKSITLHKTLQDLLIDVFIESAELGNSFTSSTGTDSDEIRRLRAALEAHYSTAQPMQRSSIGRDSRPSSPKLKRHRTREFAAHVIPTVLYRWAVDQSRTDGTKMNGAKKYVKRARQRLKIKRLTGQGGHPQPHPRKESLFPD